MAYTRPQTFIDGDNTKPADAAALHAMQDSVYSQATTDAHTDAANVATFVVAQARFQFNVKDYGAVGDDSTDNTAAFNAAIAAANPTNSNFSPGGLVFVPPGTYRFSTPFSLRNNVTVMGVGRSSYLRASTTTNYIFNCNTAYRTGIHNVAFDAVSTQTAGGAMDLRACAGQWRCSQIHFGSNLFTLVDLQTSNKSDWYFSEIWINSLTQSAMIGVSNVTNGFLIGDGAAELNQIYMSRISGTALRALGTGGLGNWLIAKQADTMHITDMNLNGGSNGIYLATAPSGIPCTAVKLTNVVLDNQSATQYTIESAKNLVCTNCNAQNFANTIGTPTVASVWMKNPEMCQWNGGTIQKSKGFHGLLFSGGGNGGLIVNGTQFADLNYNAVANIYGLVAAGGSANFTFTNCEFRFQGAGSAGFGIFIGVGCQQFICTNNRRNTSAAGAPLLQDNSGAISNKVVANNLP